MRIKLVPIIGSSATTLEILSSWLSAPNARGYEAFCCKLGEYFGSSEVYLTDSGIEAFAIILNALRKESAKTEVIIPAYTAGSLVVAIRKAGLTPVLCDITLNDFNMDVSLLHNALTSRTLAVVCVHMFGIGCAGTQRLRANLPADIVLIEDCAQSMGSKINGHYTGGFGDISFFSFGRGKNFPLYTGGCIFVNQPGFTGRISRAYEEIKTQELKCDHFQLWKALAFSCVTNPFVYNAVYPLIGRFRETQPPKDITAERMNPYQARLGFKLLNRSLQLFLKRNYNGMYLLKALGGTQGIVTPAIAGGDFCVFNRLPIVFKDPDKKEIAERRLFRSGIEVSSLYARALHQMFDLSYTDDLLPAATYFASRLMTLPVHPSVCQEDLEKMAGIIIESAKG